MELLDKLDGFKLSALERLNEKDRKQISLFNDYYKSKFNLFAQIKRDLELTDKNANEYDLLGKNESWENVPFYNYGINTNDFVKRVDERIDDLNRAFLDKVFGYFNNTYHLNIGISDFKIDFTKLVDVNVALDYILSYVGSDFTGAGNTKLTNDLKSYRKEIKVVGTSIVFVDLVYLSKYSFDDHYEISAHHREKANVVLKLAHLFEFDTICNNIIEGYRINYFGEIATGWQLATHYKLFKNGSLKLFFCNKEQVQKFLEFIA